MAAEQTPGQRTTGPQTTGLFALATAALGATVSIEAQLVVLLAGLVGLLSRQRRRAAASRVG